MGVDQYIKNQIFVDKDKMEDMLEEDTTLDKYVSEDDMSEWLREETNFKELFSKPFVYEDSECKVELSSEEFTDEDPLSNILSCQIKYTTLFKALQSYPLALRVNGIDIETTFTYVDVNPGETAEQDIYFYPEDFAL